MTYLVQKQYENDDIIINVEWKAYVFQFRSLLSVIQNDVGNSGGSRISQITRQLPRGCANLLLHYHPQTKLREGNVFAPVCDSVHKGGRGGGHAWRGVHNGKGVWQRVSMVGQTCMAGGHACKRDSH